MRPVQCGPLAGFLCQLALLTALSATVGFSAAGWGVGVVAAVAANGLLARGLGAGRRPGLGPADWVTLLRSVLAGGAAALVADLLAGALGGPAQRPAAVVLLVSLASATIVLDAVDGMVARRTGTTSALGARFDMEVDAFLIMALAVYAAPAFGVWVLAIGLARYAFVAAAWFLPWLRESAPPRYWSKVVAVVQGMALTVAAADVLPQAAMAAVLAVALALLTESFGHETWWLWRHRAPRSGRGSGGRGHGGRVDGGRPDAVGSERLSRTPRVPGPVSAAVAGAVVWCVLLAPQRIGQLELAVFAALPLELLAIAAAGFLPPAGRKLAGTAMGVVLGVVAIAKVLDMGFSAAFDRPFDPVNDWYYFGPGFGVLADSIGSAGAVAVAAGAVVFAAAALALLPLAVLRLTRVMAAHRRTSLQGSAAFAVVWAVFAVLGLQSAPGLPTAAFGTAGLVQEQLSRLGSGLADRKAFASEITQDPVRDALARGAADPSGLLAALKGRDVLLVFVESYGRVALEDPALAPGVSAVLKEGTASLTAEGFSARSAFLTSPTFGGISWLAHSTLQSGLWVDSQQRYNQLLTSNRLTLSGAFKQAGWRTVSDIPSDTIDWPQGARFYHYDALYDSRNVGYRGPNFSYATMPDQYALAAFARLELDRAGRPPVMAEIDLVSSHTPWTPLPRLVPWSQVGDGSIFNGMPAQGPTPESVSANPARVKSLYGQSIEYSLGSIFSFVAAHPDPNLVMVVLGDHQPNAQVSGTAAGHDVPVSIIARDPSVLKRISAWDWQEGMLPSPTAPTWPMSVFRDRFLAAFSPGVELPGNGGVPPAVR